MISDRDDHARDRVRQLRAFCHAAQLQSMSKAADRLSLTQPAVSRQIRALEEEFLTALFVRRGPRISLTAAGRRLLRMALPLVESMDRLPETFAEDVRRTVSGEIHITAGMASSAFVLPRYIARFRERYPDVRVHITTVAGRDAVRIILDRRADFGIGAMEVVPDNISFRKIQSSRYVFVTPPDHPLAVLDTISVDDLGKYPTVMPAAGTFTRDLADSATRHFRFTWKVAMEAMGWDVTIRYVEAGLGPAVVPDFCVTERDRVRVIPFEERIYGFVRPRTYGVIMRRDAFLSLAATRFIQTTDPDHWPESPHGL